MAVKAINTAANRQVAVQTTRSDSSATQSAPATVYSNPGTVSKSTPAAGRQTPFAPNVSASTPSTAPASPAGSPVQTTPTATASGRIGTGTIAALTGTGNTYNALFGGTTPAVSGSGNTTTTGFDTLGNGSGSGGGGGGYYRSGGGASGGGGGGGGSYTAPILPSATSQEAYIRSMYDANEQAARENLRAEYENNMAALDREAGRLPETYDTAVDAANTQAAINRLNFNEQAAMSGLNTGAGSQARLSQNNALLGNVSSIRRAQADAQADLDFQRTQMEAQYKQAIQDAVAKNDLAKAEALYQEAKRVDESIVNTAINQANLNWSIWRTLYG